jgi:predicted acetyltransferase
MTVRKIKPKENVQKLLIESTCFLSVETEDRYEWLKKPMAHTEGYEHGWGGFDAHGNLCSSMQILPVEMRFNKKSVSAGIAASVATLPEARNKGYIRELFRAVLTDMKENNRIFSFVYPFSYAYYRQFGYEHAYTRFQMEIPMEQLKGYPFPDSIKPYRKGNEFTDFSNIYHSFTKDKNLAIIRDEGQWNEILDRDPHLKREYTYLHYNGQGKADAYLLYKPEEVNGSDGGPLLVQELAWLNKDGLHAMLGFMHGLRTEYESVKWETPNCVDVFSLFPESWDVSISWKAAGMNRVVDLEKALILLEPPASGGSAVIGVNDKFLPWNTGRYQILWENNGISVSKTDLPPDMETDIETMAQLVTGYITPLEASHKKGTVIHTKTEALTALFPKRHLYMMEHY